MTELRSTYRPLPPQYAFHQSKAKIRGYGGAMGGGKSRAGCEEIFDACLDNPGLKAVIARDAHTSIVETTKKTMLEQVMPSELIAHRKASGGEDFIELFNGSRIYFIGLDDPYRWYSSELGYLFFDEAHEIASEKVIRLMTRLRQPGMPGRTIITFNPANPGHWLQEWFMYGSAQTKWGFRKEELVLPGANSPIGDCEFFFAKARDNIHLPDGYVEQSLAGLPEKMRRRYLDGEWEFPEGGFFDADALSVYKRASMSTLPILVGDTRGNVVEDAQARAKRGKTDDPPRFRKGAGGWSVWKKPVPGNRYVMAVDVASGGPYDYSAVQIVSVEDFEQVAEYQGKITPSDLAVEVYRAGRIFNNALAVPEITGGYGVTIREELRRLHYSWVYTRKSLDRLTRKWTDVVGWDTSVKTRMHMLDTLERTIREGEFGLYSLRAIDELSAFVYGKADKPQAGTDAHDDLVIALAIAVTVCNQLPREFRRPKIENFVPTYSATGW